MIVRTISHLCRYCSKMDAGCTSLKNRTHEGSLFHVYILMFFISCSCRPSASGHFQCTIRHLKHNQHIAMDRITNISSYWDMFTVVVIKNFPTYDVHSNVLYVRETCRTSWSSVFKVSGNGKGMVFVTLHIDEAEEVRNHFKRAFFNNSVLNSSIFDVQEWFKEYHDADFRNFVGDTIEVYENVEDSSDKESISDLSDNTITYNTSECLCMTDDDVPDIPVLESNDDVPWNPLFSHGMLLEPLNMTCDLKLHPAASLEAEARTKNNLHSFADQIDSLVAFADRVAHSSLEDFEMLRGQARNFLSLYKQNA
jgi:hypothetical protein